MAKWYDIQELTFTRWCNDYLTERGFHVNSLQEDLKDGLMLINLLEVISGKSLGRYNRHPKIPQQKLENNLLALKFIEAEGLKLVNIGPEDIVDGKLRLILGLIWTLILRYEVKDSTNELLKWIQSKIPEYNIKGFTTDWNDGRAICALVNALKPGLIPDHRTMDPKNALANATKGIEMGDRKLGVDQLVLPDEMTNPKVDKLAMMMYLAQFRNLKEKVDDSSRCAAYGPGLVDPVAGQPAPFTVETPPETKGKLAVKVFGPKDEAKVTVVKGDNGKYAVEYFPKTPGLYKIHVTLDDEHIPGSIFQVYVADDVSLGGEGKIRVFFSTTSSSEKVKADNFKLQSLLEAKQVHLRSDFEPWVPIDVLTKGDRDQVFTKAGTRNLPIVFIDDKYVGDYDTLIKLSEEGKLDKVLAMEHQNLISLDEHWKRLGQIAPTGQKVEAKEGASGGGGGGGGPAKGSSAAAPAKAASPGRSASPGVKAPAAGGAAGTKFCGACGAKTGAGLKFCGECGGKV